MVGLGLALFHAAGAAAPAEAPQRPGVDVDSLDRSVAPGDNFFLHANGTWLRTHEIPADRSYYAPESASEDLVEQRVSDLVRQPSGGSTAEADRKIHDYYASFMQEERIEALGLRPLQPRLKTIAAISTRTALAAFLGQTLRADVDVLNDTSVHTANLFGLWVAQDLDHPDRYVPFLLQGGLGMPDRSYYLDDSAAMVDTRQKYLAHVGHMLKLLGFTNSAARAARVVDLEQRIARVHWTRAATQDVAKGNNHWSRSDFPSRAPGLDWPAFFAAAQLPEAQQDFVVWQPSAITGIAALVQREPLSTWKDYLALHAIEARAAYLPKAVVAESFAFHGRVIEGTPELRERWKRAVRATNVALGEAVGQRYAERYFPASAKAEVEALVERLRVAFGERIDRLEWMSAATKANAKAKLATLKVGVGYPDRWRDYSGLEVVPGDAFGNAERASAFEYRWHLAKLGRPVDRGEWVMTPQTINAVNLPAMNALNFPAAILQPPFYLPGGDPAYNFGAIGAVIGHEISHSFDDQGAAFDATGHFRNWWTDEDLAHFRAAEETLVSQYDGYRPFPDLAVNGRQTLSENIADLGGLLAAYDAYRLAEPSDADRAANGLTGEQRFFLGFAQMWCAKFRDPALRSAILTDGHAPSEYRANTVRNVDAWYRSFDVKAGQSLALPPERRVRIW